MKVFSILLGLVLSLGVCPNAVAYMEGRVTQIQGHCVVVKAGPGLSFLAVQGDLVPAHGDVVEGPLMDLGPGEFQVVDVGFTFEASIAEAGARRREIDDWFSEEGCDFEDEYEERPDYPEEESEYGGDGDEWDSDDDLDAPWLDDEQEDPFDDWGDEWDNDDGPYTHCGEDSDGFDNDYETDQDCLEEKEDFEEFPEEDDGFDSDFPDGDDFGIDG